MSKALRLEILRERLSRLRNLGYKPSLERAQELHELAWELYPEICRYESLILLIEAKVILERFTEAADLLISELQKFPADIELQNYYLDFKQMISLRTEVLGLMDPNSFTFRKAYELALELGEVSLISHSLMVQYWLSQNEIEKAVLLAQHLKVVAPGLKVNLNEEDAA